MWVVKLGGSLSGALELRQWLDILAHQQQGKVVIVPGGGAFADQVRDAQRRWGIDDVAAHHMAILAMQQMALMFRSLNGALCLAASTAEIQAALSHGETALWSPRGEELHAAGIAASWDVTSDSLAAWLARELRADGLLLVKSVQIPADLQLTELAQQGIVDKAFPLFAADLACPVKLLHRRAVQTASLSRVWER